MFIVIKKKRFIYTIIVSVIVIILAIIYSVLNANSKRTSENGNGYLIMIYIEEKRLFLFENGKCIQEYPIASGAPESPSPIGEWKIVEKNDWGEGFGGYWMGLNVSWGTYGIHGTTSEYSIGYAASHGCIRMFSNDAKELYERVKIGTPVIIKDGPYGPFGTGFRELMPGDRGADVLAIQRRLKELGYFNGEETGIYEDDLKKALYAFQHDKKLTVKYTITYEDYLAMGFDEFE